MAKRRRGRPRKDGARQANGRLKYAGLLDHGHEYLHLRRAEAGASELDQRASTPLGIMEIKGLIDDGQRLAGEAYEATLERLHGIASDGPARQRGPGRTRSALACFIADAAPECWDLGDADFATQERRLTTLAREAIARMYDWRLVEDVVRFHRAPRFLSGDFGTKSFHQLQNLQHDLEELRKLYKIPRREDRH